MYGFEHISIIGRIAYIIASLECFLKINDDKNKWKPLFEVLWSFSQYHDRIDDYAYKVIECMPETILDEREDFSDFEYFTEEELNYFKKIYKASQYTSVIEYLLQKVNEILSHNLYTIVKPPEKYSLKIISDTYSYIKKLLGEQTPLIDDYKKYSIFDNSGWGIF